ncbi:MAG: ferritin family protein [Candidatus Nitrohelix vancouverensis]|uniref:Ferritin family protein n=1 Tax=Candidatus Nitrohelix vancouverensis TaxID=2705534 RepID=A0A7T0C441_9BACT|nr:MAG: ferritin family protein [Candidatus Nitrohelix vancouverensis]
MEITNTELLAISLRIERLGQAFYDKLGEMVDDPAIKDFLNVMSKEEVLHEKQFKNLLDNKGQENYGWENSAEMRGYIEEELETDIFPKMEEIQERLSEFSDIKQAFEFAVETEQVSHEFYKMLRENCTNYEAKTLLILLEKAEMEHLSRIKAMEKRFLGNTPA